MAFNRIFIAALLLLWPVLGWAESASVGGNFKGLNNGDASIFLGDSEAQDLLNVDITPNGYGIKKREGTTQFKQLVTSTWGVRGGYYYTDVAGNNRIIHANARSVYSSINGAAYSTIYSTATDGSYWDFADSQGRLYGASSNHDPIFTFDGTSILFATGPPKGSIIEVLPDRFVVAGVTATPNDIYFSGEANFTNFTTGNNYSDAFTESYGLPGQTIQALKYHQGELLIWTLTGMGRFFGQSGLDLSPMEDISNTVGTDQPGTIVTDNGLTYFQATDGHFYAYDGQGIQKISNAIAESVDGFASGAAKSQTITTQSDFERGTLAQTFTSYLPGSVVISTNNGNVTGNSFENCSGGASSGWDAGNDLTGGGQVCFSSSSISETPQDGAYVASRGYSGSPTIVPTIRSSDGTILETKSIITSQGSWTKKSIDLSNYLGRYIKVRLTSNTGSNNPYIEIQSFLCSGSSMTFYDRTGGSSNIVFDNFENGQSAITAGTFVSESISNPAITSYSNFYQTSQTGNGTLSFGIYSDSDTVHSTQTVSSWISSQTITSGSVPTITISSYTFIAAHLNNSVTSTGIICALNDLSISWFEGTPTHNWGTSDKDHRILWSVAEGTSTIPNATYIYDPRFDSWLKYSVPFDAPARVGDSIYYGGVSTGVVYQWPSGNTDNGSAITAYWKSKDFVAPDPYTEKDYSRLSVIAKTQTGSNLDVTFSTNTGSGITRNYSLTDSGGLSLKRINTNLPSGTYGSFFNIKFGNDDADVPFEVYSFSYEYKPRPWRPIQ